MVLELKQDELSVKHVNKGKAIGNVLVGVPSSDTIKSGDKCGYRHKSGNKNGLML